MNLAALLLFWLIGTALSMAILAEFHFRADEVPAVHPKQASRALQKRLMEIGYICPTPSAPNPHPGASVGFRRQSLATTWTNSGKSVKTEAVGLKPRWRARSQSPKSSPDCWPEALIQTSRCAEKPFVTPSGLRCPAQISMNPLTMCCGGSPSRAAARCPGSVYPRHGRRGWGLAEATETWGKQ